MSEKIEWTDELTIELIEAYRREELLWNPSNNFYRNKIKKRKAWKRLSEIFRCKEGDIKKKIKSLLTSFRRQRQKCMSHSGDGSDDVYASNWFAFKHMQFLLDKFIPRKVTDIVLPNMESERKRKKSVTHKKLNYTFSCHCGRNFNTDHHFKYHIRKAHKEFAETKRNISRVCPLCSVTVADDSVKHFKLVHDVSLIKIKLSFSTEPEFFEWKKKMEIETASKFVIEDASALSDNHLTITYICHRSEYNTASQDSNKFCPAKITRRSQSDGGSTVHFISTHVGHQDSQYLQLSLEQIQYLERKMALNVPFDKILDEVRDSISDAYSQKLHLLTQKNMTNFEKYNNLRSKTSLDADEWMKQLQLEGNSILYYKPRGVIPKEPYILKSDVILIIMTEAQSDILKKYGNNYVCLDGIIDLNRDFEFQTLLVVDESQEALPCAFLISKRLNSQILNLLFEQIKQKVGGTIKPKVFVSNLADTVYFSWINVMGIPEKRFATTWHVDRSWRENLHTINSIDKQVALYKRLRLLMIEPDQDEFNNKLQELLNCDDPECAEFIKFFKQHFHGQNSTFWPHCYRSCADLNANVHLEAMYNFIKDSCKRSRNGSRLHEFIPGIMFSIKDRIINRLTDSYREELCAKIILRHKAMEDIGGLNVGCSVQKQKINCKNCLFTCKPCGVCIHQFCCSCIDSTINYNMCNHVHLVASRQTPLIEAQEEPVVPKCEPKLEPDSAPQPKLEPDPEQQPRLEPDPEPQPRLEPDDEPQPRLEPDPEPQPRLEPVSEPEPNLGPDFEPKLKIKREPEPEPEFDAQDLAQRKENLLNCFTGILDGISCIEEVEAVEEMVAPIAPTLAALRDSSSVSSLESVNAISQQSPVGKINSAKPNKKFSPYWKPVICKSEK